MYTSWKVAKQADAVAVCGWGAAVLDAWKRAQRAKWYAQWCSEAGEGAGVQSWQAGNNIGVTVLELHGHATGI